MYNVSTGKAIVGDIKRLAFPRTFHALYYFDGADFVAIASCYVMVLVHPYIPYIL